MIYGLDLLGLAKYPRINIPDNFALGVFANTFGDSLPAVERIVSKGKCPLVRVHLLWSDSHSYGNADLRKITSEARRVQVLAEKYPSVKWEVSPFCEHNLQSPGTYLDRCKRAAPACTIVNSVFRGALAGHYKNEVHGLGHFPTRGPWNYSFDGNSAVDCDVTAIKKAATSADVFFFWGAQFNGKRSDSDKTPREDRKAWPSQELVDSYAFLATERGKVIIPQNTLWKSHSENSNTPPLQKEMKPVLITPERDNEAVLITVKGRKELLRFSRDAIPFIDGRSRYYAKEWGYKLAQKAIAAEGSPTCEIWIGAKRVARLNPGFRGPSFRE